ncbi:MAG: fumarate hydratase [Candidatus Cloacimonadota bacterium]|nr:MAG: fumarate hydratase [Candidatus Cloacimonadota bacterium]
MNKVHYLTAPLAEEDVAGIKVGDKVFISGVIYTARDAAHKKLVNLIANKEKMPLELKDQIIFFAGPSPARPGEPVGSIGPTTSYRMDPFSPCLLDNGLRGMIGKGKRSEEVRQAIIRNKAIYFTAIGGAAVVLSEAVKKAELIAYPELGTEAIRKLTVENFPCYTAIDSEGNDIFKK